jgi:predicted ribosomally synthesized peptide with nif11-like leader
MSVQKVRDFWQKVKDDPSLRNKLIALQEKERQTSTAAVVKLADDAGFSFSFVDYEAAVKEELVRQHAAGELNDEELTGIAGGSLSYKTQYCPTGGASSG